MDQETKPYMYLEHYRGENIFALIGAVCMTLLQHNRHDLSKEFRTRAISGDYDNDGVFVLAEEYIDTNAPGD